MGTSMWRRAVAWTAGVGLAAVPLLASAGYYQWETVTPSAASGASCGNGTPFRFFINRAFSNKTVVVFEGGGACWDQLACQYKSGHLGAMNPNGVPTNYMTDPTVSLANKGISAGGFITPFSARVHPLQATQVQSWNMVYVPYCTGDVHAGNQVNVYADADAAQPTTYYHRGYVNAQAVAAWLGQNLPGQSVLMLTGFSAGSIGATANYDLLRSAMRPQRAVLLADSGFLMQVPRNATPEQAPSVRLHAMARKTWGFERPDGIVTKLHAKYPAQTDPDNLGSFALALARIYPSDRFNFLGFQADQVLPAFAYDKFYPEIAAVPYGPQRFAVYRPRWVSEMKSFVKAVEPLANVGYYMPNTRDFQESHCLTIVTFAGTGVVESGILSVGTVVDDLIGGSKTPLRVFQQNERANQGLLINGPADQLLLGSLRTVWP